jgi:UDP-N-acetylglucosamine diphosphorylase/glucosamine-1-phosphate N-acetyltransferase
MRPLSAIVLAAGKGTRMKSSHPKVAFKLADKPMIQRVVNTALQVDCKKICVVVGFQKESVIAALEEDDKLTFAEQKEQLGTGHAVLITEDHFQDEETDILILCGDVPLLSSNTIDKVYHAHKEQNASCTVLTAFLDDAGKYGRILRDEQNQVCGIVEFKDATEAQREIKEFNTGIYCFNSADMFAALKSTSNNNLQNEYYLTDTLSILRSQGKVVSSVVLEDLMEVSGVNSQEQLSELEEIFLDRIRKKWLNNGIVMHNPSSIHIGDDVHLEPDVEIGRNCIIKGSSTLESGCIIGPNCYIESSHISNDTVLEGYNIVINAFVPEHMLIPFRDLIEENDYE